jgi:hypothetical protein
MIGIYALIWDNINEVYIGQSTNIDRRFKEHVYSMETSKKANYKVLEMYHKYGIPSLVILEVCTINELDALEISWIKEFDSIKGGLNIAKGGVDKTGINNFSAKYTKREVLKGFSLLYRTNKTLLDISNKISVQISTLSSISNGYRHCWLQEEYPAQYAEMLSNRDELVTNSNTKYPPILGPDNIVYTVSNIKAFCEQHPLLGVKGYSHLTSVVNGIRKQHKGFRLLDPLSARSVSANRPTLLGPQQEEYVNIKSITSFCSNHPLLKDNPNARKGLSRVFNKERDSYLGFKLK